MQKNNNLKYLIGIVAVIVVLSVAINLIVRRSGEYGKQTAIATGSNVFAINTSSTTATNESETVSRAIELAYTDEQKLYQLATEKYNYVPIYMGNKDYIEGTLSGSKLSATYEDIEFAAYLDGKSPKELSWSKVSVASASDSYTLRKNGDTYAICGGVAGVSYVVSGENKGDVIEAYNTIMVAATNSEN